MTEITTKASKADSNGKKKTPGSTPVRSHGVDRIREEECYHLTSLVDTCLNEAQRLLNEVRNKALKRCTDFDGETSALDYPAIGEALRDAQRCADLAKAYFYDLIQVATYGCGDEIAPF